MQMTDSDFTLNDWRRRLGDGGAGLYCQALTLITVQLAMLAAFIAGILAPSPVAPMGASQLWFKT